MTLYFNSVTKVLFAAEGSTDQTVDAVSSEDVASIIAGGATIDVSAESLLPLAWAATDPGVRAAGQVAQDGQGAPDDLGRAQTEQTGVEGGTAFEDRGLDGSGGAFYTADKSVAHSLELVGDYEGLRHYAGDASNIEVTVSNTSGYRAGTFHCLGKTQYADDGGVLVVDAKGRSWLRLSPTSDIHVGWFKLNAESDWSNAFDKAIVSMLAPYSKSRSLRLPGIPMPVSRPWMIPYAAAGLSIKGDSDTFMASCIQAAGIKDAKYAGFGVIHQVNPKKAVCRAINLENVRIGGGNAATYGLCGVYLNQNCDGYWRNVLIEAFKGGSGLVCDAAQDYTFSKVAIQSCGGTKSHQYDHVEVISVSANTTYAPLSITSTSSNTCNYLRFADCQIEGNWVSPYVRIGSGSKWIYFTNGHSEHRGFFTKQRQPWGTLFENNGGEVFLIGQGVSPEVEFGLACGANSRSFVTACPDMQSITGVTATSNSGTGVNLQIANSEIGALTMSSRSGAVVMTGGSCHAFTAYYPGYKGTFTGVEFKGDVLLQHDGGGTAGLDFTSCIFDKNFTSDVSYSQVIGGTTKGQFSATGGNSTEVVHRVMGKRGALHRTSTYVPWGFQGLVGGGKPTVAPVFIGQHYVDAKNQREWTAVGTAAADLLVTNKTYHSTVAPSSAPYAIGDWWIETSGAHPVVFLATGTQSAADWRKMPLS